MYNEMFLVMKGGAAMQDFDQEIVGFCDDEDDADALCMHLNSEYLGDEDEDPHHVEIARRVLVDSTGEHLKYRTLRNLTSR